MIEPTEDMVVAAIEALRDTVLDDEVTAARAITEAVLAIVERDYYVRRWRGAPLGHEFQPHDDPDFGRTFGGGCGALVPAGPSGGTIVCGWPRFAHGATS